MQSRGNQWDPVDNLYVRFLDFGNCVAVLRESTSSPTITTLAKWLTKDATFGDTHWIAQAVIDPEARARILRAGRIREVGVIASAADLAGQDGGLLSTLSSLDQFGDVMVELRIFTETGGDHQAEQARLSRFASNILRSPLEAALRKGHVKTVAEGSEAAASIDMIRDRITKGLPVQLSRGHDRSIRAEAACAALDDAIDADEDLLRQILMP